MVIVRVVLVIVVMVLLAGLECGHGTYCGIGGHSNMVVLMAMVLMAVLVIMILTTVFVVMVFWGYNLVVMVLMVVLVF